METTSYYYNCSPEYIHQRFHSLQSQVVRVVSRLPASFIFFLIRSKCNGRISLKGILPMTGLIHSLSRLFSRLKSDVPTTLIWGEQDPVAVPAVADYAWENYLKNRKAPAVYWQIPCAGHYLQNDQPELVAQLVRRALGEDIKLDLSKSACAPRQIR